MRIISVPVTATSKLKKAIESYWNHRNMYSMTLKSQGQNLTSGQGHVVTQVGHITYVSMRLDEINTMKPLSRL